ncbi:MAG: hypothetical protein Q9169_007515 [Polycauliona sp. 2 TL-2023]
MPIPRDVLVNSQLRRGLVQSLAHPCARRITANWATAAPRHASSLSSSNQVIFSGIQPTGIPHLGNYFGALQQWVKIQNGATSTTDLLFSIVDLHAMTLPYDRTRLRLQKRQTLAALLAVGLDPQRSTIFFQSAVRLLCSIHPRLLAERVLGASPHRAHVDFMLYGVSGLPLSHDSMEGWYKIPLVDRTLRRHDQAQHLEFARENAKNFNTTHGPLFCEPQTLMCRFAKLTASTPPAKRIMSLKDPCVKMSKSHQDPRSRILLNDDANTIRSKIKAALTDSIDGLTYDPFKRPGVSNLLALMSYIDLSQRSVEQIIAESQASSMRAFKDEVAKTLIKHFSTLKERYDYFMSAAQGQYLEEVAATGNENARSKAEATMMAVRRLTGIDGL